LKFLFDAVQLAKLFKDLFVSLVHDQSEGDRRVGEGFDGRSVGKGTQVQFVDVLKDFLLFDALCDPPGVDDVPIETVCLLLIGILPHVRIESILKDDVVSLFGGIDHFASVFDDLPPHCLNFILRHVGLERLLDNSESTIVEQVLLHFVWISHSHLALHY
jgi:hypothetical protein